MCSVCGDGVTVATVALALALLCIRVPVVLATVVCGCVGFPFAGGHLLSHWPQRLREEVHFSPEGTQTCTISKIST